MANPYKHVLEKCVGKDNYRIYIIYCLNCCQVQVQFVYAHDKKGKITRFNLCRFVQSHLKF